MNLLFVFICGGLGSVARYAMMKGIGKIMGAGFPWHTLGVNLIGAFLIGMVTAVLAFRSSSAEPARLMLITGFLGGFTTFSAFSLEAALMWQRGDYTALVTYVAASVIGTIIAVLAGGAFIKTIF